MDKRGTNGRFLTGNSGGGRPQGSRNKLSEAFLNDLHAIWEREGKGAIERTISERPWEFVRVVASVIPKEFDLDLKQRPVRELSDEELTAIIRGSQERTV